jgi:hypothetical protein
MRPRSIARFLLPVVVLSFLLGVLSVFVFDAPGSTNRPDSRSGTEALDSSASLSDPNQTTVLVLGIDTFDSRSPRLSAVWWASFSAYDDEIRLLGLPTNTFSEADSRPLNELFELNADHSPSAKFLSAIAAFAPDYPDVVMVLDEVAFARLVDFMGGAVLDDQSYDGQAVVTSLNLLRDDPQMQLSLQASLLISLSFQSAQLDENPEITSLTALMPDHAYASIPPTTLVNLLIPLLPLDPADIDIQVWQP